VERVDAVRPVTPEGIGEKAGRGIGNARPGADMLREPGAERIGHSDIP